MTKGRTVLGEEWQTGGLRGVGRPTGKVQTPIFTTEDVGLS